MQKLEQVGIDLLRDFGIVAKELKVGPSVWVVPKKSYRLAWGCVSGFHTTAAINVNTDLQLFL